MDARLRWAGVHNKKTRRRQRVSNELLTSLRSATLVNLSFGLRPNLVFDVNVSTTVIRPLHVSLNSLVKLMNLSSKLLYLTIITYGITFSIKSQRYKLRPRIHSFTLTCKSSYYDNCNLSHVCCSETPTNINAIYSSTVLTTLSVYIVPCECDVSLFCYTKIMIMMMMMMMMPSD